MICYFIIIYTSIKMWSFIGKNASLKEINKQITLNIILQVSEKFKYFIFLLRIFFFFLITQIILF